jgi:hypothetical protein
VGEPDETEGESGVCSDGLSTCVFPAASAGASFKRPSRAGSSGDDAADDPERLAADEEV